MKRNDIKSQNVLKAYCENKLSLRSCAGKFKCDRDVIKRILKKYNKHIRTRSEEKKLHPTNYWLGKRRPNLWIGKREGRQSLHQWVRTQMVKVNGCEYCGKDKLLDAANISRKYKRNIKDFMWLCRSCHIKYDRYMNNKQRIKFFNQVLENRMNSGETQNGQS